MSGLVEFLLQRIAEDEQRARTAAAVDRGDQMLAVLPTPLFEGLRVAFPRRVLAECEAKRQIIAEVEQWQHLTVEDCWYSCGVTFDTDVEDACCNEDKAGQCTCGINRRKLAILGPMTLPYADHPDFDSHWAVRSSEGENQ